MTELKLHYAVVEDNNDEDKKGKVQIRILPEMTDMSKDLLPWAVPFNTTGFDAQNYSLHLPEIGANVYVLADELFRIFYYLGGVLVHKIFDYQPIEDSLGNISELSNTAYPDIDFVLMNDGTITFNNRRTGDMGLLHNKGTYFFIDKDGYFYLSESNGNKITVDNSGMKLEDSNGNVIEMGSSSVKINNNLEVLQ